LSRARGHFHLLYKRLRAGEPDPFSLGIGNLAKQARIPYCAGEIARALWLYVHRGCRRARRRDVAVIVAPPRAQNGEAFDRLLSFSLVRESVLLYAYTQFSPSRSNNARGARPLEFQVFSGLSFQDGFRLPVPRRLSPRRQAARGRPVSFRVLIPARFIRRL
jgi:hypothetical protein